MQITGIIAEYNPFHNGHAYQIEQCRQMGADYIIVVMSGNYVQRGEPAILDKYSRTRIALENGADLVLELPVGYASSSAQTFAYAGVNLLHQLGCVTHLCFGCENPGEIKELAAPFYQILRQEKDYGHLIRQYLKNGHNYAASHLKAVLAHSGWSEKEQKKYELVLSKPNNILALSYEIALLQMQSTILPAPIQRLGAGFHDTVFQMKQTYPSATGIRKMLLQTDCFDNISLQPYLPESALKVMQEIYSIHFPIETQDFCAALIMCLLQLTDEHACSILDMSPSLWNRIKRELTHFTDYTPFIHACRSRSFPYSRIRRVLLHALLNIQTKQQQQWLEHGVHFYIRPLGFRRQSIPLLSLIKKSSPLPILSKLADYRTILAKMPEGMQMIEEEYRCDTLYRLISQTKYGHVQPDSFSRELLIL